MGTVQDAAPITDVIVDEPRTIVASRSRSDRIYRTVTTAGGSVSLVVFVLIGIFLFLRALPALRINGLHFFTTSAWEPEGTSHASGMVALVIGTLEVATIAMVLAVPVSLLAALFLTEYVPPKVRRPATSLVDLLAAIPAVIYGAWGLFYLQPHLLGAERWIASSFGFIPFLSAPMALYPASPFIVGCVVGLMMLPTATSVMREVFAQTPTIEKEGALALGSSRWRMIRRVVLPFGRSGMVGASMLALGRAFGEAISVAIILSVVPDRVNPHILQTGGATIGALIALRFGEASQSYGIPALMAAALVLFALTLLVNIAASFVVRRARSGRGVS